MKIDYDMNLAGKHGARAVIVFLLAVIEQLRARAKAGVAA